MANSSIELKNAPSILMGRGDSSNNYTVTFTRPNWKILHVDATCGYNGINRIFPFEFRRGYFGFGYTYVARAGYPSGWCEISILYTQDSGAPRFTISLVHFYVGETDRVSDGSSIRVYIEDGISL